MYAVFLAFQGAFDRLRTSGDGLPSMTMTSLSLRPDSTTTQAPSSLPVVMSFSTIPRSSPCQHRRSTELSPQGLQRDQQNIGLGAQDHFGDCGQP